MITWSVLEERGWELHVHPNGKAFYKRPIDSGGGEVNRKRDLTENENSEFGDVLFPERSKKAKIQDSDHPSKTSSDSPAQSGSSLCDNFPSSNQFDRRKSSNNFSHKLW